MGIGVYVKLRTIKLLEENIRRISSLPLDRQIYFNQNTKSVNHKYELINWTSSKLSISPHQKIPLKMNRQATDGEKN